MEDDYGHLKEIHDGVINMDISGWGEVKKAYYKWIVNDTKKYLERIKLKQAEHDN